MSLTVCSIQRVTLFSGRDHAHHSVIRLKYNDVLSPHLLGVQTSLPAARQPELEKNRSPGAIQFSLQTLYQIWSFLVTCGGDRIRAWISQPVQFVLQRRSGRSLCQGNWFALSACPALGLIFYSFQDEVTHPVANSRSESAMRGVSETIHTSLR